MISALLAAPSLSLRAIRGSHPRNPACGVFAADLRCSTCSPKTYGGTRRDLRIITLRNNLHLSCPNKAPDEHCATRSVSQFLFGSRLCVRRPNKVWA
jgi:hypothetical protein